jgi:hypothetical protein
MSKRKLILCYEAYVEVTLPTELADKLESGEIPWSDDWATICFTDPDGGHEVQEVEGKTQDVDYKRAHRHYFEDNTEDRALLKWRDYLAKREADKRSEAARLEYIVKDFVDYGSSDATAPVLTLTEVPEEPMEKIN